MSTKVTTFVVHSRVLRKPSTLQNVHGKLAKKTFLQENNAQHRHFVGAIKNERVSLPRIRWRSKVDISGDKLISLTINCVNLKNYMGICLAPILHEDFLLADIASIPYNPMLNRYLTWLGNFNFIRLMSIPNRNGR